ncbi:inverse autotransporter beta domain-containing protein [Paraherbaspirillum soli]|uniref:Inverse autotransporter beta domain-containing protein n=1 Tax=Paraherbaspirillum soli TaxID=631222 RepID=A0ABW0M857_9BURK
MAVLQIIAQIGLAITPLYSAPVRAQAKPDEILRDHKDDAADATTGAGKDFVNQQATGAGAKLIEDYLKNYGTSRVQINTDDKFNFESGSLDLLIPLADRPELLTFTQFGGRKKDGQYTVNLGFGQRHFIDDWMLGYNAFYDQNISRGHQRLGLGGEIWRDYLKLSANAYLRLSDWKDSLDVQDYEARPANGFDLRAEGYLPAYPALGAKLAYEKYFGEEVALWGDQNRKRNPQALTMGLSYTPIPMLQLGVDHKRGNGESSTGVNVQLNYQIGQSWASQTDPARVAQRRSLAGSRYDLIERNNDIVLEYREQRFRLVLPKALNGISGKQLALDITTKGKQDRLGRIDVEAKEMNAAGGTVQHLGGNRYQMQLPLYASAGNNQYGVTMVAYDLQGKELDRASTLVTVQPAAVNAGASTVAATPATIVADGRSVSTLRIGLLDDQGQPVAGMAAEINLDKLVEVPDVSNMPKAALVPAQLAKIGAVSEVEAGVYEALITSGNRSGTLTITPKYLGTELTPLTMRQEADASNAKVESVRAAVDNSLANGTAANQVTAIVTDPSGNRVPNLDLTFALSGSAQVAPDSSLSAKTDAQGVATVALTNVAAQVTTVTATVTATGSNASVDTHFVADTSTAAIQSGDLSVDKTTLTANGQDKAIYKAIVKDAHGNPVPGTTVNWASNHGNLDAASGVSDEQGIVTVGLQGTRAGPAQVTAQVAGGAAVQAPLVTLTADSSTAALDTANGGLVVDKDSVFAGSPDKASFTATVRDAHGNPVPGQQVTWATNLGTLSSASSTTDGNGQATTQLGSTVLGSAQTTAQLGNQAAVNAPVVNFVVDSGSAKIPAGGVNVDKTTILADGSDKATFSATVKDAYGNLIADATVNWNTDAGSLSGASSTTNEKGIATIQLSSTVVSTANVTAQAGSGAAVAAPAVKLVEPVQTYSNANSVTIPDNDANGVDSKITVSGRSGKAPSKTPVTVAITHGRPKEVILDLIAPSGTKYNLQTRTGDIDTTFNVDLSAEDLNGTWILRASDVVGQDIGTLNSWSITF